MTASLFEPAGVWLRKGSLDRRLAAGADPAATPALARRARQLTSRRRRTALAGDILNLVKAAEQPERGVGAAVPLQRREILFERHLLLGLADDLVSDDALSPGGVALVARLLTDGASPLYADGSLRRALTQARAALQLKAPRRSGAAT